MVTTGLELNNQSYSPILSNNIPSVEASILTLTKNARERNINQCFHNKTGPLTRRY